MTLLRLLALALFALTTRTLFAQQSDSPAAYPLRTIVGNIANHTGTYLVQGRYSGKANRAANLREYRGPGTVAFVLQNAVPGMWGQHPAGTRGRTMQWSFQPSAVDPADAPITAGEHTDHSVENGRTLVAISNAATLSSSDFQEVAQAEDLPELIRPRANGTLWMIPLWNTTRTIRQGTRTCKYELRRERRDAALFVVTCSERLFANSANLYNAADTIVSEWRVNSSGEVRPVRYLKSVPDVMRPYEVELVFNP